MCLHRAKQLHSLGPGGAADRSHGWSVAGAQPGDAEPVENASIPSYRPSRGGGGPRPREPDTRPSNDFRRTFGAEIKKNDNLSTGFASLHPRLKPSAPIGAAADIALQYSGS